MRDLLLVLVMAAFIPLALRKPIVAAVLYVIVTVLQPNKIAWGFAVNLPWAWIFGGVLLISVLPRFGSKLISSAVSLALPILFGIWALITSYFALDVDISYSKTIDFWKMLAAMTLVMAAIRTWKDLFLILLAIALSVGFYATKGAIWVVATLGAQSLAGPADSPIGDRNALAVAMVMTIPLLYWLSRQMEKKWQKIAMYWIIGSCIVGTIGTYSRGGFVTLVIVGAFFIYRSKARFASVLVLIPICIAALVFMPDKYMDRLSTIKTYEQDESAMERIDAWKAATAVADKRFTGAGAMWYLNSENFVRYAPLDAKVRTAHSIYFQALGEHGYVGLVLFVAMYAFTLFRMRIHIIRERRSGRGLGRKCELLMMLELSLLTYLVGGALLSLVYWEATYFILVASYWAMKNPSEQNTLTAKSSSTYTRPPQNSVGPLKHSKKISMNRSL